MQEVHLTNTPIRSSKRLQERCHRTSLVTKKKEKEKEKEYVDHMYELHSISGDLLDMADKLDAVALRGIIGDYENIIERLLNIEHPHDPYHYR